jgi:hypothetical protein
VLEPVPMYCWLAVICFDAAADRSISRGGRR